MGQPINKLNGLDWKFSDIQTKFQNSFVLASVNAPRSGVVFDNMVTWIRDIGDDGISFYQLKDTGNYEHDKYVKFADFIVEEERPLPCISNFEDTSLMFLYNPDRQWKRGVSDSNCFMYYGHPHRKKSSSTTWCLGNIGGPQATRIFHPEHCESLADALSQMKNKDIKSRALNNDYWLIRNSSGVCLYRRRCLIGMFIGKRFFLDEGAKIMSAELKLEIPMLMEEHCA